MPPALFPLWNTKQHRLASSHHEAAARTIFEVVAADPVPGVGEVPSKVLVLIAVGGLWVDDVCGAVKGDCAGVPGVHALHVPAHLRDRQLHAAELAVTTATAEAEAEAAKQHDNCLPPGSPESCM